MESLEVSRKTLEWLLEDDNPPVRNLTKKYILDEEPTKTDIKQIDEYFPIKTILSSMKPDGAWTDPKKPYKKYTGSYWQFIFLSELNANSTNKNIQKAAENIFSYQLETGTFPHELNFKKGIHCLTANLLRAFIHFGYEEDNRVQKGIKSLTNHILDNKGVTCIDLVTNLLPDCQMSLTKLLAMYAKLDKKFHTSQIREAIKTIEDKITENRILFYIPTGAKEYQKAIKGKKVAEMRKIKAEMSKQQNKMKKTEIKNSWKRFGFPNSYTSDVLETLYWLAMIGTSKRSEFNVAIEHVIKRMDPSGHWKNEINFRSPMIVEIEPKKSPSKWLTFRACFVLKSFNELVFT
ncbi:MAG: hypothetical protein ACXACR_15265 [Candidatus Hodarchaeales archaeon]|jgi:hypothetical protein